MIKYCHFKTQASLEAVAHATNGISERREA
jgi:hypothetical protein